MIFRWGLSFEISNSDYITACVINNCGGNGIFALQAITKNITRKREEKMIKIGLYNNKGGVGKSVAVINIAHTLLRMGKRVAVIDADKQMNSFHFFSDEPSKKYSGDSRYENIEIYLAKDVYKIPNEYDYIIYDLPPALDSSTKKILSKCDYVFVPIELGTFAISGIANVTDAVAATKAKLGGCFINKFDYNNPADLELDKMLRETLGDKILTTRIPNSRVIKNSISFRQTAFEYMPWANAAELFKSLTHEIMWICGGGVT